MQLFCVRLQFIVQVLSRVHCGSSHKLFFLAFLSKSLKFFCHVHANTRRCRGEPGRRIATCASRVEHNSACSEEARARHHTFFCVQNGSFEPQNAVSNNNRNTAITLAKRKIQAGACSGLWRCSDRGPPDCCFCYRPLTASRFENQQQADLEIRSCTLTLLCY